MKTAKVVKSKAVLEHEADGWISILRTGRFVDSAGTDCSFSEKDLDTIVKNYDPSQEEAPLVLGHPKTDAPAYGWAESLKRVGNFLLAKPHKVVKELKEAVAEGRYGKISVKLEDLCLKHIGFLGAALPAVSGLGTAKLSAEGKGMLIELAYGDIAYTMGWKMVSIGQCLQRFRDYMIEEKGVESADKVISQWMIDDLKQPPKNDSYPTAFSEAEEDDQEDPMNETEKTEFENLKRTNTELTGKVTQLTADVTAKDATILELKSAQEASVKAAWETERNAFCADLQKKGIVLAAELPTVKSQLDLARDAGKGEFAAGKNPQLDQLKTYLLAQKPKVKVGELPPGDPPANMKDAEVLSKKASEYQASEAKAGRIISLSEAVKKVQEVAA